jgi:hypothetical protein
MPRRIEELRILFRFSLCSISSNIKLIKMYTVPVEISKAFSNLSLKLSVLSSKSMHVQLNPKADELE